MNRLIQSRKKQLNQLKHILRLQDLLTQYDRQNAFLNYQVKELLKQNEILHNEVVKSSSRNKTMENFNLNKQQLNRANPINYRTNTQAYSSKNQKQQAASKKVSERKRYNYHFDDMQVQTSLKKKMLQKEINSKNQAKDKKYDQVLDKIQKYTQRKQVKQQEKLNKKNIEASKIAFQQQQKKNLENSKSRSKSRSGSKKKLQVTTNQKLKNSQRQIQSKVIEFSQKQSNIKQFESQSRLIQQKLFQNNINHLRNTSRQDDKSMQQTKQEFLNRSPYLQNQDLFLHSFGQNYQNRSKVEEAKPSYFQLQQTKIEKKPSQVQIQFENKLKNSTKKVQTFNQQIKKESYFKTEQKVQTAEKTTILRSLQKRKNHELNPSPKISLTKSKKFITIHPFVIQSQKLVEKKLAERIKTIQSGQEQIQKDKTKKRRFLTVTSSSKEKRKN